MRLFLFAVALPTVCVASACADQDGARQYAIAEIRDLDQALVDKVGVDELLRMSEYLDERVPRDAVSNTVHMGVDEFDCVFIERQPSLEKMRREGRDVEAILAEVLKARPVDSDDSAPTMTEVQPEGSRELAAEVPSQPVEEFCPLGTVPVRQIPLVEMARYGTLEGYKRRTPQETPAIVGAYEYANVRHSNTTSYGVRSDINLWSPAAEAGDHSISQMWVSRGTGDNRQTVEAGWRRDGDDSDGKSRLFVYFTNHDYDPGDDNCEQSTCSCYNLDCGFIQSDNTVFIDGVWTSYSAAGGSQFAQEMSLTKLYSGDNWHFMFGTKWVGLWLVSYFDLNGIFSSANRITFGGEVYDLGSEAVPTPLHTTTDMGGDGTFGSNANRWQHAAFQKRLRSQYTVPNGSFTFATLSTASEIEPTPQCYDAWTTTSGDANWGRHMYFGGIGRHTSGPGTNWCQYQ
jgi:hypothetical protein